MVPSFLYLVPLLALAKAADLKTVVSKIANVFNPLEPANHTTDIDVGVYFEHLYDVNDKSNRFTSDFYLTFQWFDPRWKDLDWDQWFGGGIMNSAKATCDPSEANHRRLSAQNEEGEAKEHGEGTIRFIELGSDEMGLVWLPDLHIRNQYKSERRSLAKMMRVYEDGKFELSDFVWSSLQLQDPDYHLYPFDNQELGILIESASHTTERVRLHPLHDFTGLEESLTDMWPGWDYKSHTEEEYEVAPEYSHKNPCRTEKRSRIKFIIKVHRHFNSLSLLPVFLLVATSWAGFFIKVSALMPRIATGFISFLTINNMNNAIVAKMPAVNHAVWMAVFLNVCRYSVFLSVLETGAAQYIATHVSLRIAMKLDHWSRMFLPTDFVLIMIVLFSIADHEGVGVMNELSMLNLAFVVVFALIYLILQYVYLRNSLRKTPLKVFGDGRYPLDYHEVEIVFNAIDGNCEGMVTVKGIVSFLLPVERHDAEKDKIEERLTSKLGKGRISIMTFTANQKAVFAEFAPSLEAALDQTNGASIAVEESKACDQLEEDDDEVEDEPAAAAADIPKPGARELQQVSSM